jgi:hypothetical protein
MMSRSLGMIIISNSLNATSYKFTTRMALRPTHPDHRPLVIDRRSASAVRHTVLYLSGDAC